MNDMNPFINKLYLLYSIYTNRGKYNEEDYDRF